MRCRLQKVLKQPFLFSTMQPKHILWRIMIIFWVTFIMLNVQIIQTCWRNNWACMMAWPTKTNRATTYILPLKYKSSMCVLALLEVRPFSRDDLMLLCKYMNVSCNNSNCSRQFISQDIVAMTTLLKNKGFKKVDHLFAVEFCV